jgi:hypothetical protein
VNQPILRARPRQHFSLRGHNRLARVIALSLVTPVVLKEVNMQIGFHPFCTDLLLQTVGEIDDGCDKLLLTSTEMFVLPQCHTSIDQRRYHAS